MWVCGISHFQRILRSPLFPQVGTCVSEGSYPAGTLSWHLDGKPLVPNEKGESEGAPQAAFSLISLPHPPWDNLSYPPTIGVSVKEETRRHPETGLFTLQSELMVTPARGGNPHPTFSCSFSPGLPRRRALHTAPIQPRVWGEQRWGGLQAHVSAFWKSDP